MGEIIPIRPHHVISQIKLLGFRLSENPNSQRGVSSTRKLPKISSPGWKVEAVDRDGYRAQTPGGKLLPNAEAVELSYYGPSGSNYHEQLEKEQLPIVIDHLRQQGYSVKPMNETKSQQGSQWPSHSGVLFVSREA